MEASKRRKLPERKDGRVIIHFDYDCFYASVFEAENPALKFLPLAVQQKQIIVTCNYEARKRGLHKLQLITEAKRLCPDVIILLGEDIGRFRDASKELYGFLEKFSWNRKVERLGFDEVWMDVTDLVEYNLDLLNANSLQDSFFHISKDDPTLGFPFNASEYAGHVHPTPSASATATDATEAKDGELSTRLRLGSHLAIYVRHQLEELKGYTATVGISTNKLLSKLVGNLNKPKGQTTLVPPYIVDDSQDSNVTVFIDAFDIGKIPGIGFKLSQKIREHVLQRAPDFDAGLVYGGTREAVTVRDVRLHPHIGPESLETLLSGPGSPHGIGLKIWMLLHGCDDTEVGQARPVPRQISIEDSYIRLDTLPEVLKELSMLSRSLITRMRIDLLGNDDDFDTPISEHEPTSLVGDVAPQATKKWLAHPRTIRLSTRPRPPLNADGTRTRSFKRISHSAPLPNFVFSQTDAIDALAEKLVNDTLITVFRKLHPEKAGWNLSLVNVAVTNMAEAAGQSKSAMGRDIGGMFRRQDDVLKDFRVVAEVANVGGATLAMDDDGEQHLLIDDDALEVHRASDSIASSLSYGDDSDVAQDDGQGEEGEGMACRTCGACLPLFALPAHERYHQLGD